MKRSPLLRLLPAVVALGAVLAACAPEGSLDSASVSVSVKGSTVTISGWAWDRDAPTTPIDVHVYLDGAGAAVARADKPRPDVAAAIPEAGPNHGYTLSVNVSPGAHQVCVYGINAPDTGGDNGLIGCRDFTVAAPATTAPSTPAPPAPPSGPASWKSDVLSRINASRQEAGVGALTMCAALESAAQGYAQTMASNQWFDATGPDGSDPWVRVATYGGTATGENIAFGFDSPASLTTALKAAPAQYENMVREEFTHVGVGRALGDPDGSGPEPAAYYWVQEFGTGGACS